MGSDATRHRNDSDIERLYQKMKSEPKDGGMKAVMNILMAMLLGVSGFVGWTTMDTRERVMRIEVKQDVTSRIVDTMNARLTALELVSATNKRQVP